MFLGRVMRCIRPAFIVEIVQQRGDAPEIFVCAQFACDPPPAGLYGQRMFAKAFTLRVLAQKLPRLVPIWHFSPVWSLPHCRMAPPEAVTPPSRTTKVSQTSQSG